MAAMSFTGTTEDGTAMMVDMAIGNKRAHIVTAVGNLPVTERTVKASVAHEYSDELRKAGYQVTVFKGERLN